MGGASATMNLPEVKAELQIRTKRRPRVRVRMLMQGVVPDLMARGSGNGVSRRETICKVLIPMKIVLRDM